MPVLRPIDPSTPFVGPFLKWAGGKGRLLEQYARFLPASLEGRDYVEPFLGGGAMFFHVRQRLNPRSCTLLDINPDLVNAFRQIRDNVEAVIPLLASYRACHNREEITEEERKAFYYGVRETEPEWDTPEAAARMIYLNKTCFNGLYRLNSKGKFNVPIGSYKFPAIFSPDHLRRVCALLQGVIIEVCPFRECERYIADNAFVYFDPPYAPLSRTASFTAYAKEDFNAQNQRELRDLCLRLSHANGRGPRCQWMQSNSAAPLIEELYAAPDFHKARVLAARAINSVAENRETVEEVVISSLPPPDEWNLFTVAGCADYLIR